MNNQSQIQCNEVLNLHDKNTAKTRLISSGGLFEGQTELLIEHGREIYRLRQTSQGKLILTK